MNVARLSRNDGSAAVLGHIRKRTRPSALAVETANVTRGRGHACRYAGRRRAFTLLEVLAALMLMAIVVPVAMQGMSIASRAGVMGQRKAAAMRVADRLLNEFVIGGQIVSSSSNGTLAEGDGTYEWALESQTWTEDAMVQLTVRVSFSVQGNSYSVTASTLADPIASNESLEAPPPID